MKHLVSPRARLLVAATLAAVGSTCALAQSTVNPTAVVLQRLKATSANKTSDGYVLQSIKLKGDINTDGIKFTLPSVVPEKPLVLMQQRVANCNDREVLGRSTVNKTTENSETFSKSTTLGGETTVSVSYESPIGLGGSASQSFNYSSTNTQEKTYTESVGWDQGIDVPVGPKQALTVQFVVSEQKLDGIPWSTNAIVAGAVEMNYKKSPGNVQVCLHQHSGYGGKKKCWNTSGTLNVARFKDVSWDGGGGNINDEVTGVSITGSAKVTLYEHHDFGGWSAEYTGSNSNVGGSRNDKFSSIKIESLGGTKTVTESLEKYLNDQQRRIALSGKYNGVNGVQGDFRAGSPVALTDNDCGLITVKAKSTAGGGQQAAVKGQAGAKAVVETTAVNAKTAPIQGKVLVAGVKPSKKQVVKASIKK